MLCPAIDFRLFGYVSIDAGPSANGLLYEAERLHGSIKHTSRSTALQACLGSGQQRANMIGYGRVGKILTGSGDVERGSDQYISLDNFQQWQDDIRLHRRGPITLILCSCDTGAENEGALLLYSLAKEVDGPVTAPTGFVLFDETSNSLELECGAHWQEARPDHKPDRIKLPRPYTTDPSKGNVYIRFATGMESVPIEAIEKIRYFRTADAAILREWSGAEARRQLAFFGLEQPAIYNGSPFALRTGRIELVVRRGPAIPESRTFDILNQRVLRDTVFNTVYYYANVDEFTAAL
jgi:hypothetical protein